MGIETQKMVGLKATREDLQMIQGVRDKFLCCLTAADVLRMGLRALCKENRIDWRAVELDPPAKKTRQLKGRKKP